MTDVDLLPAVEWRNLAAYVVAAFAAWWSSEAEWFIPPVVGVAVAVLAVVAVQWGRRPAMERVG
jgi:cytosine permease